MTVLMTKRKYDALISIERDKYLLSDNAARDRAIEAEPEHMHELYRRASESREWLELRMKHGQ